jgi:predicted GNAT family acetyltransferase
MVECKEIEFKDVPFRSDTYGVEFKDNGLWFGLYDQDNLVSVANVITIGKKHRLKSNFTDPSRRGRGYFTTLLAWIVNERYAGKPLEADCLQSSYRIYEKLGFTVLEVKNYKKFDIYKVAK